VGYEPGEEPGPSQEAIAATAGEGWVENERECGLGCVQLGRSLGVGRKWIQME